MSKGGEKLSGVARGDKAETSPLENPLDFISQDHMREREVCALIDRLVAAFPIKRADRQMVLSFLKELNCVYIQDMAALSCLYPDRCQHNMYGDFPLFATESFKVRCSWCLVHFNLIG